MIDKLRELVEYFSVPAFVFSVDEREIIASNALVIRTHGLGFLKNCTFRLKDCDCFPGEQFFLRINRKEPELVLETCPEGKAVFKVLMFSDHLGLAYEALTENLISGCHSCHDRSHHSAHKSCGHRDNFHLSYIYNIGTGRWTFSKSEQLSELGIIKPGESCEDFDWRKAIVEEDLPLYDNTFCNAIRHGGNHEMHYRVLCLDGGIIPVADYCGVTIPDNQWPIMIGSIVATRQSEEAMIQAEKQVLTGRLMGGMVHDFKNLLGGIRNMIEWAIKISHDPQVADALHKTLGYTDQATELICGTLRLNLNGDSSIHNGDGTAAKIEKINFDRLVHGLENLITRIIPTSTQLQLSVDDNLPAIYGRKSILQDMLLNLCVNARDAMKKKGDRLTISVAQTEVANEHGSRQPYIVLSVEDNGCGMSKNEVKRVFDAFYSTKDNGVGLGMWMVRNAVQSFDGRIEVESKVGEGTVVRVLFPVVEPDFNAKVIVEETQVEAVSGFNGDYSALLKHTGKTILYIEDNVLVSSSVRNWLESLGFRLFFADDGLAGKALFERSHREIDLVIQDYILPGMKGDELLAVFNSLRPDIPVIVVSAENDEECTRHLLESGAAELIRKPFKMDELLQSLSRVLSL